jgi:hypothetical protein
MKPWYTIYQDENVDDGADLGGADDTVDTTTDAPADTTTPPAAAAADTTPAAKEEPAGDWAPDWRSKISPDAKHQKTLERFDSPKSMFESYMALRQKLDSGELKPVSEYPADGKPEQQAEWRKAHGIPDAPEGYELAFDDGLVIGEHDKPIVEGFLKAAHESNASPEQVNKIMHWYYEEQERMLSAQEEKDSTFLRESEDVLRAEWGGDFRANINMIRGLVDTMPADVKDLFVNARLGDGNALLNHPDMARWLAMNARTINPVATVVPGAGANIAGAIDDEITTIEKTMRENRKAYNADSKMQNRLRELYSARERAKA